MCEQAIQEYGIRTGPALTFDGGSRSNSWNSLAIRLSAIWYLKTEFVPNNNYVTLTIKMNIIFRTFFFSSSSEIIHNVLISRKQIRLSLIVIERINDENKLQILEIILSISSLLIVTREI